MRQISSSMLFSPFINLTIITFDIGLFLEFIHMLSSEAQEICDKSQKKTVSGEHVIDALQVRRRRICPSLYLILIIMND